MALGRILGRGIDGTAYSPPDGEKGAKSLSESWHARRMGGGLYLRISLGKSSGKPWVFLYRRPSDGKRCEKQGLAAAGIVTLARAREKASASPYLGRGGTRSAGTENCRTHNSERSASWLTIT